MEHEFVPEHPEQCENHIRMTWHHIDTHNTLIIKVINERVNDELWGYAMANLRLFLRWVHAKDVKFHFIFDVHECMTVPAARMGEMLVYLKRKRPILLAKLHSSVVLTSNRFVQLLFDTAVPPGSTARPLQLMLVERKQNCDRTYGIPAKAWEEACSFLRENRLP